MLIEKLKRILSSSFAALDITPDFCRHLLLTAAGIKLGENAVVKSKCFFNSSNVLIGNNSFLNRGFEYYDGQMNVRLVIGNGVFIGPNCHIIAVTHEIGDISRRAGEERILEIKIGNGTWIGSDVVILPGVQIADGCVIGAGAVLTKSTNPNGEYLGVPARRVREL